MMYVFFDLENPNDYKATDLKTFRAFVERNYNVNFEWWQLGTGAKVIFSECGKYSIEQTSGAFKYMHLIQTIANDTEPKEKQN